jgi:malonyl CoA-acyl carrier protein transacylase
MDKAAAENHGGLLAIQGMRRDEVNGLCAGLRAWIAIAIGEEEFVIGGEDASLDKLNSAFAERGAKQTHRLIAGKRDLLQA